jgi:hypothetical protein
VFLPKLKRTVMHIGENFCASIAGAFAVIRKLCWSGQLLSRELASEVNAGGDDFFADHGPGYDLSILDTCLHRSSVVIYHLRSSYSLQFAVFSFHNLTLDEAYHAEEEKGHLAMLGSPGYCRSCGPGVPGATGVGGTEITGQAGQEGAVRAATKHRGHHFATTR